MNFFNKCSLFLCFFIIKAIKLKIDELPSITASEDKLNSMINSQKQEFRLPTDFSASSLLKKAKNLLKKEDLKLKPMHEDIYAELSQLELIINNAILFKCDDSSQKSFLKLNYMANNIDGAAEKMKKNVLLKTTLRIILFDNNNDMDCRIEAAKLTTRLFDIPVSIQTFNPDPTKSSKTKDTYVIVPRIQRVYRPDEYIENYKAGNWNI